MSGNICAATNSPSPCSKVTTTSSTSPAPRGASSPTTPNASPQSHPEPGRRSILEAVGISRSSSSSFSQCHAQPLELQREAEQPKQRNYEHGSATRHQRKIGIKT